MLFEPFLDDLISFNLPIVIRIQSMEYIWKEPLRPILGELCKQKKIQSIDYINWQVQFLLRSPLYKVLRQPAMMLIERLYEHLRTVRYFIVLTERLECVAISHRHLTGLLAVRVGTRRYWRRFDPFPIGNRPVPRPSCSLTQGTVCVCVCVCRVIHQ